MSALSEPGTAVPAVRLARQSVRRRQRWVFSAVALVWLGLAAARVLAGDYTITIPDFVRILFGADIPVASFLVLEDKLPRAVGGTLAGFAFGTCGAVFQSMLRNPLASPDIVGVTIGSSAAAVIALVWFGWSSFGVAAAAIVGGLATAAAVLFFSGASGGSTTRLILVGIALAAAMHSIIQWVLITADVYKAQDALVWLTGSLGSVTWPEIVRMLVGVLVLVPLLWGFLPQLGVLEMGDDAARGLGVRARPTRLTMMAIVVVVTAVTTSVVGPIAFVALLSGPIARQLNGGRASPPLAGGVGACLVVGADYIGAYLLGDSVLPVGVVTGAAGAPFLIWLLVRSRRSIKEG